MGNQESLYHMVTKVYDIRHDLRCVILHCKLHTEDDDWAQTTC